MLKGTIIKNISNHYTVLANNKMYICTPRGKFRKVGLTPLVGDEVTIDENNNYILDIDERKNFLLRPSVSNVDIMLIVTALKNPSLSLLLLDKEISLSFLNKIEPVICFTKIDLLDIKELEEYNDICKYYKKIGIKVFDNRDVKDIIKYLKDKKVVLTGQSGAGKSSLLNKIDSSLNIKTDEISYALNRGKHTTRHTEIFNIEGINFFDTPGFSSLSFTGYSIEKIKESFPEFKSISCRYEDCNHEKEADCEVKKAVKEGTIKLSRYENYLKIIGECKDGNIRFISKK